MLVKDFIKWKRIWHLQCIELHKEIGERRMFWMFLCECGVEKIIRMDAVFNNSSCGCVRAIKSSTRLKNIMNNPEHKEFMSNLHKTHWMIKSSEYNIWAGIKSRTWLKPCGKWISYKKRWIKMCDEWRNSFEQFYTDMWPRPDGMSIDRIDNNGNYEPSNCRWATAKEQNNNTSRNVIIEFNWAKKNIRQWCEHFWVNRQYLYNRRNLWYDFNTTLNYLLCHPE